MDDALLDQMIEALAASDEATAEEARLLDIRWAKIKAARAALENLRSKEPVEFDGKLADACREVLKRSPGRSLSPVEVRDQFKVIGYDVTVHKNQMASVHSVLKRLAEPQKDIKHKEAKDGSGTRYWWAGPVSPTQTVQGAHIPSTGQFSSKRVGEELATFEQAVNKATAMMLKGNGLDQISTKTIEDAAAVIAKMGDLPAALRIDPETARRFEEAMANFAAKFPRGIP